jgi:ferredoxin-nitrite reductase
VPELLAEPLVRDELRADPPLFTRGIQTCTGKEFCGLAKVFTKERAAEITTFLNAHVQANGHGEDLRVHFAGCSSSCAQHQIADIGIEGVLKRVDGKMIEAMDIRIGGRLGPEARFGEVVVKKVPHWDLNAKLLEIFDLYERHHQDGETFREFAASTPSDWWQRRLAEPEVAPAPA